MSTCCSSSCGLKIPDKRFDLTGDQLVDQADRDELVVGILQTSYGDVNLDQIFNSQDLVQVFQSGRYEKGAELGTGWEHGDWDGDGQFGSSDLVLAFQSGGYTWAVRPRALGIGVTDRDDDDGFLGRSRRCRLLESDDGSVNQPHLLSLGLPLLNPLRVDQAFCS